MSQYIPFSGATASFIANIDEVKKEINIESETLLNLVNNNQVMHLPTTLAELDRETIASVDLSIDAALALSIPFGATDNKISRRVFIYEYKKFKEIAQNNEKIHYGISIRWVVNIRKLNSSANVASLPMVTASAQINNLSASVTFEVVGISSKIITQAMPANVDLKADSYADLKNAFEKIKSNIYDDATIITPSVLGIYGSVKSDDDKIFNDSVAIAYALKNIKEGKKLNRALANIDGREGTMKETVKSVYQEIAKLSDLNTTPSEEVRNRARGILNNLI